MRQGILVDIMAWTGTRQFMMRDYLGYFIHLIEDKVMNSKIIFATISLFLLCSYKCNKEDVSPGYINNLSDRTILASLSNNYPTDPIYPDTILPLQQTTTVGHINPMERKAILHRNRSWKKIYADIDTMSFYLFDLDTLEKYPWETIREQYKILKRYNLSF